MGSRVVFIKHQRRTFIATPQPYQPYTDTSVVSKERQYPLFVCSKMHGTELHNWLFLARMKALGTFHFICYKTCHIRVGLLVVQFQLCQAHTVSRICSRKNDTVSTVCLFKIDVTKLHDWLSLVRIKMWARSPRFFNHIKPTHDFVFIPIFISKNLSKDFVKSLEFDLLRVLEGFYINQNNFLRNARICFLGSIRQRCWGQFWALQRFDLWKLELWLVGIFY